MSRRLLGFAPLALLVAVMIAAAVTLGAGERTLFRDVMTGQRAPVISTVRLDGETRLDPAEFGGGPYVVNFFASWCAPCRAEHPLLDALAQRGVTIVGLAYKDTPDKIAAFLDREGDPFAHVGMDPDGRIGLDFGITGVPETFVVDRAGRIVWLTRKPLDAETIERGLLPALAQADRP